MPKSEDQRLAEKVKDTLLHNTESTGIDVKVDCVDGVIRLKGIVDVLSEKLAAEEIARGVPGVKNVESGLTVAMDGQFNDKHIQKEVTSKLADHPETRSIGAEVHGGEVKLVGQAETLHQEHKAKEIAQGTRGVRGVDSQVKVGTPGDIDDATITNEVERMLANSDIGAQYIQTYTADGVVHLKGWVDDEQERRRVVDLVRQIHGVRDVRSTLVLRSDYRGIH